MDMPEPDLAERCTALSMGTRQWFDRHALWAAVADDACPIRQVHVSHKGYFGATRLDASELHADAVGYVVSNRRLNASLGQRLRDTRVRYFPDTRVTSVSYADQHVMLETPSQQVCARLVIAADGVSSMVREAADIDTRQVDYEQLAVLSTIQLQESHRHVAYERFTPSGPLALLPRPGDRMSVVDCIEPDERESVGSLSDTDYLSRLQERFGYRLGRFAAVGPRFITPLIRIEASRQVAPRTVLLGSAMRLLHPVGGQGYNLAMRDVDQLVRLLAGSLSSDPGSASLLDAFVTRRARDQRQVVQFTDTLARLFRGKAPLPAHARALGLLSLDTLTPLRQKFARRTMGLS